MEKLERQLRYADPRRAAGYSALAAHMMLIRESIRLFGGYPMFMRTLGGNWGTHGTLMRRLKMIMRSKPEAILT